MGTPSTYVLGNSLPSLTGLDPVRSRLLHLASEYLHPFLPAILPIRPTDGRSPHRLKRLGENWLLLPFPSVPLTNDGCTISRLPLARCGRRPLVAFFQDQEFPGGEPWNAAIKAGSTRPVTYACSWGLKNQLSRTLFGRLILHIHGRSKGSPL